MGIAQPESSGWRHTEKEFYMKTIVMDRTISEVHSAPLSGIRIR